MSRPSLARNPRQQRGVVMVVVVIAMLALLAMAGLALDGSNTMLNKTRLQTVVDASALSAAKTLDQTGSDVVLAESEARTTFADNAIENGNGEVDQGMQSGEINLDVEFSNTLMPFVPGTSPAFYVRVTATNLRVSSALLPLAGVTETVVEASAIAGPSVSLGNTCNIAPMMVCTADSDPILDPLAPGYDPYFGYTPNEITVLKAGSPDEAMTKGNFQLIRTGDDTGANDLRHALAGSYNACITSTDPIETEPGNSVGPVAQGLNTRMNIYTGPMQGTQATYPPDTNVTQSPGRLEYAEVDQGDGTTAWEVHYSHQGTETTVIYGDDIPYSYAEYDTDKGDPGISYGVPGRRQIAMPLGVCGEEAGQSQVPYAGVLCFFLLQDVDQGPDPDVFGQFTPDGCQVEGTAGPIPTSGPGPYVIQLYKDPARSES